MSHNGQLVLLGLHAEGEHQWRPGLGPGLQATCYHADSPQVSLIKQGMCMP